MLTGSTLPSRRSCLMPEPLDPAAYTHLVGLALAEDVGAGDVTTRAVVPSGLMGHGVFLAKAPVVVAGLDVAAAVLAAVDSDVRLRRLREDGDHCAAATVIAEVTGRAASLLVAERTALNFLQYLSGIATMARAYVEAAGRQVAVLDTRKTTPAYRMLAKYAVRCGGATNHRAGLYDEVLIKDNHIRVAGGIAEAMARVRGSGHSRPIEVEISDLAQVDEAIGAGADIIMLDNFDEAATKSAIARIAGRARVELSGNMTLERVRALAPLGADMISVGALTHSAAAADISFDIRT